MRFRRWIIALFFILVATTGKSQVVYQDLHKNTVYDFLDELANLKLTELNTLSKPYSRELIANKLTEINPKQLNDRQQKELVFFLKDFNKELKQDKNFDKRLELLYYKDSLFSFTLNPIAGYEAANNSNGSSWRRYSGGEMFGYIGKNVGFYASLRDNSENEISQNELFLNQKQGANYKGSGDFSELRGGITYGWKWGSLGLLKDNFTWGNNNFGANIISNKAPSFTRLQLKVSPVKWLDFEYFHASLASEVRDSSRSYLAGVRQRLVDVRKYMAANFFTIKAIKNLNVSIGNSIIYSDNLQAAFFIPFAFFKSIDHGVYAGSGNFGGGNSQLFFDVSSRNIKGIHLFSSIFIDEISFSRFWKENEHTNFASLKFGAQVSNLFNKNISLTGEFTRTNPVTYRHFVNTTTYESNNHNLGHYLRDNAEEIAFKVDYKPIARLQLAATYILSKKAQVYFYSGTSTNVQGLPFLDDVQWESSSLSFNSRYELFNDVVLFLNYQIRDVSGADQVLYTNDFYQGKTNTIMGGLNIGFP